MLHYLWSLPAGSWTLTRADVILRQGGQPQPGGTGGPGPLGAARSTTRISDDSKFRQYRRRRIAVRSRTVLASKLSSSLFFVTSNSFTSGIRKMIRFMKVFLSYR